MTTITHLTQQELHIPTRSPVRSIVRENLRRIFFFLVVCSAALGATGAPATSIRSKAELDSLLKQASSSSKMPVVFLTSSSPNCADCARMRKSYLSDAAFTDWLNRFAVYGELDLNTAGKSVAEANMVLEAARAVGCPGQPAMVLLHPSGKMLEYQPVDHVPSQAATLFHEIYLSQMHQVHPPGSANVSLGKPPERKARPGTSNTPEWTPPNAVPVRYDTLKLRSITGSGSRRFILVNDQTLAAGESGRLTLNGTRVTVKCQEIGEAQAMVQVDGEPKPRLLLLESSRKTAAPSPTTARK